MNFLINSGKENKKKWIYHNIVRQTALLVVTTRALLSSLHADGFGYVPHDGSGQNLSTKLVWKFVGA